MVKYQFTSQDAEKQINQVAKLYEIIEQQANIIKKLQNDNDQLSLQLQKLSQQLDNTQCKQQSNSDLLEIKGENQNKGSSIIFLHQDEKKIFQSEKGIFNVKVSNPLESQENTQYQNGSDDAPQQEQNIFLKNTKSLFTDCNLFDTNTQLQSIQVEPEKVQQLNNIEKVDTSNNSQKQSNIFNSLFNNPPNNEQEKESNNNIFKVTKQQQIDETNNNQSQQQKIKNNVLSNHLYKESCNIFGNQKNSNLGQGSSIFDVNQKSSSIFDVNPNTSSLFGDNPNIQLVTEQVCMLQLDKQQKDNFVFNENQKQQINFQEDNEQESLLFGDPSFNCSNVQISQSKAQDKDQQVIQDELINNIEDIKELENSKENNSQNSSSNEKREEFQIIQQDEDSNSI